MARQGGRTEGGEACDEEKREERAEDVRLHVDVWAGRNDAEKTLKRVMSGSINDGGRCVLLSLVSERSIYTKLNAFILVCCYSVEGVGENIRRHATDRKSVV